MRRATAPSRGPDHHSPWRHGTRVGAPAKGLAHTPVVPAGLGLPAPARLDRLRVLT
ncbi:hypothetical protein [Nonomuraea sp. NPDC048916]|uniref:hypothetical protein n=1 Tax=Nonomuraea sp. NPDC048916 TaxID=3154232 RepID=UPI00340E0993